MAITEIAGCVRTRSSGSTIRRDFFSRRKTPKSGLFLAVMHHLDDAIGRVVKAIDDSGQRENTIIFFSSDNGPQVNWGGGSYPSDLRLTDFNQPIPFRGSKTDVWEGGFHVPGFVNWPGKIKPKKINSVHHVVDWLPTIGGIIGTQPTAPDGQPKLDGVDFSAQLLTDAAPTHADRELYVIHAVNTNKWSLRRGDWKLVRYGKGEPTIESWQLFNLKTDPREATNVASAYPTKVKELHNRFLIHRAKDKKAHNFPDYDGPQ